ncbi:hypothetical protein HMPREF1624_05379 [Sporothrix schenckii ATCC 58251]|uniref:Major facilitator superfamily (MFS) profile domain-containing protein n=1 Tax=Sporothrix schenckii (strain ATCC 58251 / de Perez 2211183) TaxID=1391915 RepID=U7PSG8_SPOS1|nr:hypothetical protein HMPREF1624_05379 [Sporothrix schenckii ATCC 58251]
MAIKLPFLPPLRLYSPFWQNVLMGVIVGLTAGLYQSLTSLGAGGLRANSAHTVEVVNATLCATWFVASLLSGTVLNLVGPSWTAALGVFGYAFYVAGLWYFDATGQTWFPIVGGVLIGISAGLIFVVMGTIAMTYSEEDERGSFITISQNLQALGAAVAGFIDLMINRNRASADGVPIAVYIIVLSFMGVGACLAFLLRPPSRVTREDGTSVATAISSTTAGTSGQGRTVVEELRASWDAMKNWDLLLMIPAFLPSECFLVYGGSANAFRNNLRTRTLLSFVAVVLQIPAAYGLRLVLDHAAWKRRTRALVGLGLVGTPLVAAWIWQMVEVRHYDRGTPTPADALVDWTDAGFVSDFFLFTLTWVSSVLFQYIILYFLSCMTNSPRKAANYAGVYRSFLAAGEAVVFGIDSAGVSFLNMAAVLFAFYTAGVFVFLYLALFHVTETQYFTGEDDVVIPQHVLEAHEVTGQGMDEEDAKGPADSVKA